MTGTRARQRLAAVLLWSLALGGCTDAPADPAPSAPATGAAIDLTASEAGDLRLELERRFGLQAHLLLETQRAPKRARQAAAAALEDSADELVETVGSAHDDTIAERFDRLWQRYSAGLTRSMDAPARRRRLHAAGDGLAGLMADSTGGRMESDGTAALLRTATRQFLTATQARAEGDHEDMYRSGREAFADMVTIGRAFAAGTSEHQPDRYPGPRSSGPLELRSALRQLLAEHALLTNTVLQRSARGAKDFAAAAAALNGNTDDLVAAVESIYSDTADEFGAAWRDRISGLADYTVAAVEAPMTRKRHRRQVSEANTQIATLLAGASDDNIDGDAAETALALQADSLLAAIDASVDKDDETAAAEALKAHGSAIDLADELADGIVAHLPGEFPIQ